MANILALAVKSQAKHMGRVGFDPRSFPPGTAGPFSHPTCDVPFPPRRPGEYWQLMFPARPLYRAPGGQGIGLGSRTFERASGPSCVLPKGVQQGQTESGGIVLATICWAPSAQRRCHPEEALYLPTFSHLLIVNKLLSLSLSLNSVIY